MDSRTARNSTQQNRLTPAIGAPFHTYLKHKRPEAWKLAKLTKQADVEPPFIRQGVFPFFKLPAELRMEVLKCLLPHDMVITFKTHGNHARVLTQKWPTSVRPRNATPNTKSKTLRSSRKRTSDTGITVETQLFLVSKEFAREARGILHSTNTYSFKIDGEPHLPLSLRSPLIFGPFGREGSQPLLRDLRSIELQVVMNSLGHMAVKRQRARLEYFVQVLKEHADDADKQSLLQELKIEFSSGRMPWWEHKPIAANPHLAGLEVYMFGLEGLKSLRGIKTVNIVGLPDWYARCLQLCIQGKGGEVKETNWPLIETKRSTSAYSKKQTRWVTTRKWYQPTLNWKAFAQRNNIAFPDNIDKFWVS